MYWCGNQFYVFKCCAGFGRGITPAVQTSPVRRPNSPDHPNPALPITETPSPAIARIGWALRVLLITDSSSCLKDRKVKSLTYERVHDYVQLTSSRTFYYVNRTYVKYMCSEQQND